MTDRSHRTSFFSPRRSSAAPPAKRSAVDSNSAGPGANLFFRCGLVGIHAAGLSVPSALQEKGEVPISSSFRFAFDGRMFKTPIVKNKKDPKYTCNFDWVWSCDESTLGKKALRVEYLWYNKGKPVVVGQTSLDAISAATGPVKWELEVKSTKGEESLGIVKFDFHMEQFTEPLLHIEFKPLIDDASVAISPHLFPEVIQIPHMSVTKVRSLPRERGKSLSALGSPDTFQVDTKFLSASLKGLGKGGLIVVLKMQNKRRDHLNDSYFRLPIAEVLTVDTKQTTTFSCKLAKAGKVIGKVDIKCSWQNMCSYAQLVGGFYNSQSGLSGEAMAVPGAHPPTILGTNVRTDNDADALMSHVVGVAEAPDIQNIEGSVGSDGSGDFNFCAGLPAGWEEIKDASGNTLYRNFITGESQSHHPFSSPPTSPSTPSAAPPEEPKKKRDVPKAATLKSRPSQMFSGFTQEVSANHITEAEKYKTLGQSDFWQDAGSDEEGEDSHFSQLSTYSAQHYPAIQHSVSRSGFESVPSQSQQQPAVNPFTTFSPTASTAGLAPPPTTYVNPFATLGPNSSGPTTTTTTTATAATTATATTNPFANLPRASVVIPAGTVVNPFLTNISNSNSGITNSAPSAAASSNVNPFLTTNPFTAASSLSAPPLPTYAGNGTAPSTTTTTTTSTAPPSSPPPSTPPPSTPPPSTPPPPIPDNAPTVPPSMKKAKSKASASTAETTTSTVNPFLNPFGEL